MKNISRGPGFAALLLSLPALVFIISLLWQIIPASALETYYYQGPDYSASSSCGAICVNGSISGSVILAIPAGFTGSVSQSGILGYGFTASGVGGVSTGGWYNPTVPPSFTLVNGQMSTWTFDAATNNPSFPPFTEIFTNWGGSPGTGTDTGRRSDGLGNIVALGLTATNPPDGTWSINPKTFGVACLHIPGVPTCGEPINLSSGNVFDQVTDYDTAGPNKLSLIRYYNSFAMPDTYAVSMGHNWRTNYDRYLHIINPSAIYGVEAERPDGAVITFTSSSGTYTPDSDVDMTLSKSGSTWTLTDHDDTVETYSQSGTEATLQSITQRNGFKEAIGYSSGQISYVSDSYGRQLGFSYSSGRISSVSTPDSLTLSYGYVTFSSTGSQLQTVSYNTSPATTQTYQYQNAYFPYALTGIKDENGNQYATWGYDGLGRGILSELNGAINYTSVYYNDSNGNRVVKGPLGLVETYKFTNLQGVPKVTEIDRAANGSVASASETFGYDSNGYLRSKNDWNGNNTTWVNNSHGQPTQISFASNTTNKQITNITYDFWWPHLQHTVATTGLTSNFTYDSSGNMLTQKLTDTTSQSIPYSTNGQTRTWTYTYNKTGEVLTAQLPRTDVTAKTTYAYNGGTYGGSLKSVTDALSHATTITQATGGFRPKKIRDPNSVFTTLSWTPRNWLSSSVIATSAGNLTTAFTYDSAGNLTKETLPDNSFLAYTYDAAHRPTQIADADSNKIAITYDSAGDLTQSLWKTSSNVTKRQHTATYDALGRMLTSVGGASQTTSYSYDKNGNVLTITDPLSHISYISSDQLNRPYRYEDAKLYVSTIAYDSHSRPLTFTDPKGNSTTYVYNGFGDMIQRNNPDTLKTIFWYDPDSNLTGKNETGIHFSSATYDALDRQAAQTFANDSSLNVAFTYDQTGHGDGIGRLTSLTDQSGSLSRSYEPRGLVTSEVRAISSSNYSSGYTYDSAGRYSSITYASSGWVISYIRDSAGYVTSMTQHLPGHSTPNVATSIHYLPFGPPTSWTYSNGVTDARTFDLDYRMTSITDHGTANIQYLSYGYDADNNLHTLTDNVTPANDLTITYDAIDRLSNVNGGNITYDSNSNSVQVGGVTNTVPAGNDLISASNGGFYLYDSAGNLTSVNGGSLQTYSQANRMASVNNDYYRYDAFGRRIMAHTPGSMTRIEQYDLDGHLLTETNSGHETDYVYLDGMPISELDRSAVKIYPLHTDRIGTVTAATDGSKVVQWLGAYAPYGAVAPSPANITMNLRFPGMHEDPTGFYQNGVRYYYPGSNNDAYTQPDPIGLTGPVTPWSNPMLYAGANPFKYKDPSGQFAIFDNIAGGLFAAAADAGAQWYFAKPGQPFQFNKTEIGVAFGAGVLTDGLSSVFKESIVRLPVSPSGVQALKVLGTGVIAADTGMASTALLNKTQCRNGSTAIAALAGSLSGAFGTDVVDALTVIKFPSLGAAAGIAISNAPAFIPNEGGASCTCSH